MAANVLYFGPDEWKRVEVLESAGYAVHQCLQISDLKSALEVPPQPVAVVINSLGHTSFAPAVKIIHTQAASMPVIAFPSPGESGFEQDVDLVIPPLTPPEEWLKEMAALLNRSRAIQDASRSLRRKSALLRGESAALTAKSASERQRSDQERRRIRPLEHAARFQRERDSGDEP